FLGEEVDLGARHLLLQATQHGRSEDDVPDGTEADDQDFHGSGREGTGRMAAGTTGSRTRRRGKGFWNCGSARIDRNASVLIHVHPWFIPPGAVVPIAGN